MSPPPSEDYFFKRLWSFVHNFDFIIILLWTYVNNDILLFLYIIHMDIVLNFYESHNVTKISVFCYIVTFALTVSSYKMFHFGIQIL